MLKRGFTLIELLIVIAVLGILAIAVLSAINPIEQINRSKDTGSRSDSEQLISAVDRYYASAGYYPWTVGADSDNTDLGPVEITTKLQSFGSDSEPLLTNLSASTGELKESFVDRVTKADYNHLWIYNKGGQGDSTYVCFSPKSKDFLDKAKARCDGGLPDDLDGVSTSICNVGTPAVSFSCLP